MKTRIDNYSIDNKKEVSYYFIKNIFLWLFTAAWFIILLIYIINKAVLVLYILFAYSIFLALNIYWIILLSELGKKNLKLSKKIQQDDIRLVLKDKNFLNHHNYYTWANNKKKLVSYVNDTAIKKAILYTTLVPAATIYYMSAFVTMTVWQNLWLYSILAGIILLFHILKFIFSKNEYHMLDSYQIKWQCTYFTKYWDKIYFY